MLAILVIAVSLSMDAFSLSLVYGTLNLEKKTIILQSLIVGLFHFFMPRIGIYVGDKIFKIIPINPNIIVFIVLFIIGLQMILESFKEEKIKKINIFEMIIFGFAVSIDSFSLGLGIKTIYPNVLVSTTICMIVSFIFTYFGLIIGKKVNGIIGKVSTIIGGIILVFIGLIYIV